MQEDGHGGMWFYNYGRGLFHVSVTGEIRQLTAEDGFPGDRVYCFTEDWEGNWWAGLDAGGLARVRERQFHAVTAGEGAAVKAVKSVSEGEDGTVWLGELGGGLGRWRDGNLTSLSLADRAGEDSVFCVCAGRGGRMWLSAGSEDLFTGKWTEFTRVSPVVHGVKAIMTDHTGRTWFGATSGLLFAELGQPEVQQFRGMGRRDVRALSEGPDGVIWAGTGSGEIFRVSGDKSKAFHPSDALGAAPIWSVLADQDGTVWAGTFRGGLLRFRDEKFTRFGKQEGLPDAIICQILDDGQGNLWMGSHLGIFRIAKSALSDVAQGKSKSVSCLAYGRSDGLPSVECTGGYQPSAWRGKDGKLWFTTLKGAAWIRPEDVRPNLKAPPVVIEDVMVDGLGNNSPGQGLQRDGATTLEIPPGKHQLEFRYTGLSLASSERVQFRYRLEGVDPEWVSAGTRRFAHYGFLPPGNYRFDVMACNSDGVWSEAGAALGLVILPHYYETVWFRVLAGVVLAGAVAGSVRYAVTRRLHRKLERLERQQAVERERARIAKDIHDDLGASLTLIAVLGDLAKRDKASERIERMSNTARQAVKSLDEIVWAVNPRNDTLAHLIDYTGQFATDYLRDAGIRCLLDVPDQTPVREVPANVRHNVFLAVKEALQNIVKHAHATQVWLRVAASPEDLRIDVEDNGQGFNGAPTDAWADGLGNMSQRLKEVGGDCRVQSLVGKGTAITIELPWPM
jgi:signal transduction histidine kinase